jgi:phage baseplate assembly protein gpV
MVGGNYFTVTVNNAAASVLAKAVVSMGPVTLTAGTLQLSDTLIYSANNTSNAITQSAGSVLTLNNSQTLIPDLSNVARNSFGGFYSILHSVYDKANSTFGGTSLSAISYSQIINAEKINLTATTASTSNLTGTLIVAGGIGVKGNVSANGIIFDDGTRQTTAASAGDALAFSIALG